MSEDYVDHAEIKPLLGKVKASGGDLLAFCPVHNDGVKHGGKGGHSLVLHKSGVLKCYAGCDFKDVLTALRANAPTDIREKQQPGKPKDKWPAEPRVAYDYRDPYTGELVAVKGRFEREDPDGGKPEKTFRWRRPEGTYKDGLQGVPIKAMPLWGAEKVVSADPDRRVWIAEGESATEAIRARNELAVCGAWSASQREFGDALKVLHDRDVILWPDNDPPGREYMQALRQALLPIARSVAVVSAPVPPKGDAVEYFQQGGTIEALLENVLTRPAVDVISSEHIVVRVPTESGPVAFDFDGLVKFGGAMNTELTVSLLAPGQESEPYSQRVNLLSQSARGSLETALGKQFGKDINWTTVVSTAYARVRQAFLETEKATPLSDIEDLAEPKFLIETMLPEDEPTIIFGDGSTGKTYLTYSMALSVALGTDWMGHRVAQHGPVLIIDYETGARMARFRFRRLLQGYGLDPVLIDELPISVWEAGGIPLQDQVDAIIRHVQKHGVKLIIIDAGGDACGGEPEKAMSALQYFNALGKLPATSITICHITKDDGRDTSHRPFGSSFWHNRARRTWFVKRDSEEGADTIDVAFMCRKVNDGKLPFPFSLEVSFDGSAGPVTMRRQAMEDIATFASELPAGQQVWEYLKDSGKSTVSQIVEGTGLANDTVRQALNRGREKGSFVPVETGGGRGKSTLWGVAANE